MEFKTQAEYFSEMLAALRAGSGVAVAADSEPALRLKALASELELLGAEGSWIFRQSFPQTADGENLDLHAAQRGLVRFPAAHATGTVRFYSDPAAARTVPAGTVVLTPAGDRFVTTKAVRIPARTSFGDAPVRAEAAGSAGNLPAGSITTMALPPVGITWCENPEPFSGGSDAESDEHLRERLLAAYKLIKGSANAAFYEAEARAVEGVANVSVVPRANGRGTVTVYISSVEGVPSNELVAEVQARLSAVCEVAVDITVLPASPIGVTVRAQVFVTHDADTDAITAEARDRLPREILNGYSMGRMVFTSEIVELLLSIPGVKAARVSTPLDYINHNTHQVVRLNSFYPTYVRVNEEGAGLQ